MAQKPQGQSECRILKTRISHEQVEVEFFDVTREVHEYNKCYLVASSGHGQACLDMPKVIANNESALP